MKLFLTAILTGLSLSSCAQLFVKEKTYKATGGLQLNGAKVASNVKPMGGKSGVSVSAMVYNAGFGETDGPFLWRVEAVGQEGVHESLTVHKILVKTEKTGRSEPYPAKMLGVASPFELMKGKDNEKAGKVFAKYQMPGKLEVFPEVDGKITMEADISIKTVNGKRERTKATFAMVPSVGRETHTIFLPTEIVGSLGRKDPTEWDWNTNPNDRFSDDFWGPGGF